MRCSPCGDDILDLAQLTPQERAVAALVVKGKSNRGVAGELLVSIKTIEQLTGVYAKLSVRSRAQLADRAQGGDVS